MNNEIERKFLIDVDDFLAGSSGKLEGVMEIHQAYLVSKPDISVRAQKIILEDRPAGLFPPLTKICVKIGSGPVRTELEHDVDPRLVEALLASYPTVRKVRYNIKVDGMLWEVDKFIADHKGLWVAEVELDSLEQEIELPSWVREEVTWNADYYNCNLAVNRYVPQQPSLHEDVEKSWNTFWRDIVSDEEGKIDIDRIKCELSDYEFLLNEIPGVYDYVTGGKISKPNTRGFEVKSMHDDHVNTIVSENQNELIEMIRDCSDMEEVNDVLDKWS